MNTKKTDKEAEQTSIRQGPGVLLQAARIEQGIALDDIARQMNLNVNKLKSLEDDDYSEAQSPIFIRGYLRTYSRLVGLDEDETIRLFSEFYQKDDPEIKAIGNTAPEISSNDACVKWTTYFVVLILVALLSVWWVNQYDDNPEDSQFSEAEVAFGESDSLAYSDKVVSESDAPITLNPLDQSEPEVLLIEPIAESSDKETVEQADLDQLDEAVNESASDTPVNNGNDVLEVNITATSWADINDSNKAKLKQDLLSSGDSFQLIGQAPFDVFLGNGHGVEIIFNGQSFDFSEHIKSNNTARFKVGL